MGSRGTITLSIQPASGGLFPRHTLHHAPLQSGAVGLHLSLCSRVYVARTNSKAPLSFPVETRAPRHGERSGNGRCFLRRPTPLILILLHIVGQIGGKCAWRPLGYRATRPPPSPSYSSWFFASASQTTILIPSINIFGLSRRKNMVEKRARWRGLRSNHRMKRSFIFPMKIYRRRFVGTNVPLAQYFSKRWLFTESLIERG